MRCSQRRVKVRDLRWDVFQGIWDEKRIKNEAEVKAELLKEL
jgi:hypothetical protein